MILFANLANELYAVLFVAAVLGVCILFCWVMLRPSLHPKQKGLATERYRWLRLCLMALVLGPLMSCSIEIFVLILVEAPFRQFVYFVPIMTIAGMIRRGLRMRPDHPGLPAQSREGPARRGKVISAGSIPWNDAGHRGGPLAPSRRGGGGGGGGKTCRRVTHVPYRYAKRSLLVEIAPLPEPQPCRTSPSQSAETIAQFDRYVIPNYRRYPVCLVRGEGSWMWDPEGKRYLDLFPGWGCSLLGHCPPRVVEAIREQVGPLIHVTTRGTWSRVGSPRPSRSGVSAARLLLQQRGGSERGGHQAGPRTRQPRAGTKSSDGDELPRPDVRRHVGHSPVEDHAGYDPMVPGFVYVPFDDVDAVQGGDRRDGRDPGRADPGGRRGEYPPTATCPRCVRSATNTTAADVRRGADRLGRTGTGSGISTRGLSRTS